MFGTNFKYILILGALSALTYMSPIVLDSISSGIAINEQAAAGDTLTVMIGSAFAQSTATSDQPQIRTAIHSDPAIDAPTASIWAGGTTSTSTCYVFTQNLTLGSTGPDVVALNNFLIAKGFLLSKDLQRGGWKGNASIRMDYFAQATAVAVKKYQASVGIPATGFVGPITLAKLNASCATGTVPIAQRPKITSISPKQIYVGSTDAITLYGSNFNQTLVIALTGPGADTSVSPIYVGPKGDKMTFVFPASIIVPGTYSVQVYNYGVPTYSQIDLLLMASATLPIHPAVTVSNPVATLEPYITRDNTTVAYTVRFGFTLTAGASTVYIPVLSSIALVTSSTGLTLVSATSTGNPSASLQHVGVSPSTLSGDTPNYYVIPAGLSRQFFYNGVIDNTNGTSGLKTFRIAGINYGTAAGVYTSGINVLDTILKVSATF